jgi:hypothetical protein
LFVSPAASAQIPIIFHVTHFHHTEVQVDTDESQKVVSGEVVFIAGAVTFLVGAVEVNLLLEPRSLKVVLPMVALLGVV